MSQSEMQETGLQRNEAKQSQYWYFRFHENFFDNMPLMKMQTEPGGYEFVVILLKLYCLSVRTGGVLECPMNDYGQVDIPTLASMLRHEPKIVSRAIEYFIKHKFLQLMESVDTEEVTVFLPGVKDMTGKTSKEADRKRAIRHAQEQLPKPEEKHEDVENSRKDKCKVFGTFKNVWLLPEELTKVRNKYENANVLIENLSIYKARENKEYPNDYAALLGFAKRSGILKVSERERRQSVYERYKKEAQLGFPPPADCKEILTDMQFAELEQIAEENME
ncbi:phage replisome organizer N-terminal domain-containing protein [Emergencia sp. 1XD21-10]|uniref:phage replisome organizer N-terminal domain-containing protein n=1 Tax=Emergencia sp. 1XD21-10 TaxID=2304569 RepID=UPI00137AD67B|nr:phage replisome organizer N-terminal domain-containing protein [Emergencia sp. 1XD21-10]NCE98201.1 hypothetical protein [Emergencia sp. 1XD21-10]